MYCFLGFNNLKATLSIFLRTLVNRKSPQLKAKFRPLLHSLYTKFSHPLVGLIKSTYHLPCCGPPRGRFVWSAWPPGSQSGHRPPGCGAGMDSHSARDREESVLVTSQDMQRKLDSDSELVSPWPSGLGGFANPVGGVSQSKIYIYCAIIGTELM